MSDESKLQVLNNTAGNEATIYINNMTKVRIFVLAAAAILMTFGRNEMLPFAGIYTVLDQSMNIFVIATAFFAAPVIFSHILDQNIQRYFPILMLSLWVFVCLIVGTPSEYWPNQTALVSIGISILICSQISRVELRYMRYCMLLLACVFSLYSLIFASESIRLTISGSLATQLGDKLSPANIIAFPRIMYIFIITSMVTLFIEKDKWLKIGAVMLMVIPIMIALASGNRGSLIAFVLTAVTFILSLREKRKSIFAAVFFLLLLIIGYAMVVNFLPVMEQRIVTGGSDVSSVERLDMWTEALDVSNISLFGRGAGAQYPHNIFVEFYLNYGIVGFVLILVTLANSLTIAWKCYIETRDIEVLWIISLLTLQLVAQQFSLDIFTSTLWAVIVLPLGLNWNNHKKLFLANTQVNEIKCQL